ncbi:MAG: DUF3160 domain-containing protein [Tissierellia bacterium]|nr:DUF3160 domain-containing protein [Tissierellia bacterium]
MKKISILLAILMVMALVFPLTACKKPKDKEDVTKQEEEQKEDSKQREDEKKEDIDAIEIDDAASAFLDDYDVSVEVPYTPAKFQPNLKDRTPKADLSDVANISLFPSLTAAQKKALVDRGFFIGEKLSNDYGFESNLHKHMHEVYDENEYSGVPNFITTDSLLHVFHLFYDNFLMDLEANQLLPALEELADGMMGDAINQYEALEDERTKDLALKNIGYFVTIKGLVTGGVPDFPTIPDEAIAMAEEEIEKIEAQTPTYSDVMDMDMDFSQMKPRGHYTKSEDLEKYFRAVMYMGQAGFFPVDMNTGQRDEDALVRALLMTHIITNNEYSYRMWSLVHDPIDFLVETSDDLEVKDFATLLYGVYGKDPNLNELFDDKKMDAAYSGLDRLPKPSIGDFKGQSFRFMSQRAVIDNVWMQQLLDIAEPGKPSNRPIYSGKDLFGVFGMKAAEELQMADERNKKWDLYEKRYKETKEKVASMKEEDWKKNLYRGWLWTLMELTPAWGEGYPHFMQSKEWKYKDLNAGLGSWAELKHDTLLYGKQTMAEKGGFFPERVNYVEPNVNLYNKLAWLVQFSRENLDMRGLLNERLVENLKYFQETLEIIRDASIKELEGKEFTEDESHTLDFIAGIMERIIMNFFPMDEDMWVFDFSDENMYIVADLMMTPENTWGIPEDAIWTVGLASPRAIFALFPLGDELYIGRGSVFSVYEFLADERLNDDEWKEMVKQGEIPQEEDWWQELIEEDPVEIALPSIEY